MTDSSSKNLNVPNAITFARLVMTLVVFVLLVFERWPVLTTLLFVIAVLSDVVDGYIARKYHLITVLGRIMDPLVDKVIICGTFILLAENPEQSGVRAWMAVVVVSRELLVTGLRGFLESEGIDFSAASAGKLKMLLQSIAATVTLAGLIPEVAMLPVFGMKYSYSRDLLIWAAVIATIYSGVDYVIRGWHAWVAKSAAED